ncbi:MAG: acylphosphatase, partial [Acidobacteria bacterium]
MGKASTKLARKYIVSGRVQGVGYRFFAERCAHQLGISGYVKNCW